MLSQPEQNRPNSSRSQGEKFPPAPRNVVQLLDLAEIDERFAVSIRQVYRAVAEGRLHAYGRPGRQKYYSEAELVVVFGEPPTNGHTPPASKRQHRASDVSGE